MIIHVVSGNTPSNSAKHRPFSSGMQYMAWDDRNCCRCAKYYDESNRRFRCQIQEAISMAAVDDGTVQPDIALRMGAVQNGDSYTWDCPEREEEAKP